MCCYRRILQRPLIQRAANAEVLRRLRKYFEVIKTIEMKKLEFSGPITRRENHEKLRLIIRKE